MKKGFTLVELLAVIVILTVVALIAAPLIMNVINESKKKTFEDSMYGLIKASDTEIAERVKEGETFPMIIDVGNGEISYKGETFNNGVIIVQENGKTAMEVHNDAWCGIKNYTDDTVTVTAYNGEGTCNGSTILAGMPDYTDPILNGTDPVLSTGLIPVNIADNGTVTKANTKSKWYDYTNKKWANAVLLKSSNTYEIGETINPNDIKAYFVWIPKYSYQLFDLGDYANYIEAAQGASKAQTIKIRFGTTDTLDSATGECTTPMLSGETGSCQVGDYMTHPAFISLGVNGFWAAKFETTGTIDNLTVLPGETSLRNQSVGAMFNAAKNLNTTLRSHMMKNTEWGAVAYLSHTKYGINKEVRINNNSDFITGYASADGVDQSNAPGGYGNTSDKTQPYNTSTGYKASTTGNITGVYDMSGGALEFMAAFVKDTYASSGVNATMVSNNPEYFDIYEPGEWTDPSRRILGDATAEMGPFYQYLESNGISYIHNSWYADYSNFVNNSDSWVLRGGQYTAGVLAGQFRFGDSQGAGHRTIGFRLVLAP